MVRATEIAALVEAAEEESEVKRDVSIDLECGQH